MDIDLWLNSSDTDRNTFFALNIIRKSITSVVLVALLAILLKRLFEEVVKPCLDVFRVIQYSLLCFNFLMNLLINLLLFADPSQTLFWLKLRYFCVFNVFGFQLTNQL